MATPDAPCTLLAPAHGGTLPPTTLRFEHLLAYADSVFFVLSLDGTALYVSPSAARVLQADAKALVGCVDAKDLACARTPAAADERAAQAQRAVVRTRG